MFRNNNLTKELNVVVNLVYQGWVTGSGMTRRQIGTHWDNANSRDSERNYCYAEQNFLARSSCNCNVIQGFRFVLVVSMHG